MSTIQNRMFELLSALQKSVRRGLEEDALFFALELEENFHSSNLWNMFATIASEDIGLANPFMSVLIEALHEQYLRKKPKSAEPKTTNKETKLEEFNEEVEEENKRKPWLIFVSNAVLALCRSPKNKTVDDFLNVVKIERERGKPLVIPAYALDMHTRKGRLNGMGWKEFFEEGSKLVNESDSNPYRERHRKLRGD